MGFDRVIEGSGIAGAVVLELAKVVITEFDTQILVDLVTGEGAGAGSQQPLLTPDMVAPAADGRDAAAVVPAAPSNLPRPPRDGASR